MVSMKNGGGTDGGCVNCCIFFFLERERDGN